VPTAARLGIYHSLINHQQKLAILIGISIAVIVALIFVDPISQNQNYHQFADTRAWLGMPNAADVLSNIGFAVIGCLGLWFGFNRRLAGGLASLNKIYLVFFLGIFLTAFGSGYYHLSPSNHTLVWDRLPMTVAFMAFFAIVIGEQVSEELATLMFGPLIIFGIFSVAYWSFTEQKGLGDLRIYALVQFLPILLIPLMLIMFKSPFTSTFPIWLAIIFYMLAKVFELFDKPIYQLHIGVSGHTIKHIAAALGSGSILWGLLHRKM